MQHTGILLVNLGSPDAPTPEAVGVYLRQFLMDPYVISIPWFLRYPLVHWLITPRRAVESAGLYKRVWLQEGSPLIVNCRNLAMKLSAKLPPKDYRLALAMRYGSPALEDGLATLKNTREILIVPLYPQYALSSFETCLQEAKRAARKLKLTQPLRYLEPFFDQEAFISPLAAALRESLATYQPDHIIFSYHGLPESHIRKTDPSRKHCFNPGCCDHFQDKAPLCYRAQCYATTNHTLAKLAWPRNKTSVAFQSRLGRRWIKPYTDQLVEEFPKQGIRKLLVTSPAFTADCLETVEELNIRLREQFLACGGEELKVVPSLNDRDDWVDGLKQLIATGKTHPLT